MNYFAGIELGGTKIKCLIASDPDDVADECVIPTTNPEETLPRIIDFVQNSAQRLSLSLQGAGVSCFGPLDLDPQSSTYGWITSTPKKEWRNFPVLQYIQDHLGIPVRIETDVNGAALAEGRWGAAVGLSDYVYITVGTGIGGGVIHNFTPLIGMSHPEIGHMKIQPHPDDPFQGNCPYHTNCLEGLANAPSIAARWKSDPTLLADDHQAWIFEAFYLGQAIHNLILFCAPKKVILGGGVLKRNGLIEKTRDETLKILNGYIVSGYLEDMHEYIVPPALGDRSGALGAIALFLD